MAQYLIPGYGWVDEGDISAEFLIPGFNWINISGGHSISVPSGNLVLSKSSPNLSDYFIYVDRVDLSLSEFSPNFIRTDNREISPDSGNLTLSESSPDLVLSSETIISPNSVNLIFTTFSPDFIKTDDLRVSQVGIEAWVRNVPKLRVSQVGVEVWRKGESGAEPHIVVSQVGLEVWRTVRNKESRIQVLILAG